MLRILERHGSTYLVLSAALRALCKLGAQWVNDHALTLVLERLADVNEANGAWQSNAQAVRAAALRVLGLFSLGKHVDKITHSMLQDEHSTVRAAAVNAMDAAESASSSCRIWCYNRAEAHRSASKCIVKCAHAGVVVETGRHWPWSA